MASAMVVMLLSPVSHAQLTPISYDQAATAYQNLDFSQAEKIWSELASDGNANAQYALAVMHLKGEASKSDNKQAYQLLKKAAEKNHQTAIFNLGVAYWEGTGTEVNKAKALNWWEVAARNNDSGAQFNLGLAYYIGDGREPNVNKALTWIEKAEKNGHPQAPQLLDAIRREVAATATTSDATNKAAGNSSTNADSKAAEIAQPIAQPTAQPVAQPKPSNVLGADSKPVEDTSFANSTLPKAKPVEKAAQVSKKALANTKVIAKEKVLPKVEKAAATASNKSVTTAQSTEKLVSHWQSSAEVAPIRSRPSATAIELKTLKPNTPIKRLKNNGDWIQIEVPGNYAVWIHGDFVKRNGNKATVSGNNVNVRPLPEISTADAAPVGRLNTGDKSSVLLARDGWVKIIPEKPLRAWILKQNVRQYRASNKQRAQEWVEFSTDNTYN